MPAKIVPTPRMTLPDGRLDPAVELTLTQAAVLCGVAGDTVRRRHAAGLFPNARRLPGDRHRRCLVSIADLANAELLDWSTVGDPAAPTPAEVASDATEIARLRAEVAGLREAFEARGVTIEAQAQALEALRMLLHAPPKVA